MRARKINGRRRIALTMGTVAVSTLLAGGPADAGPMLVDRSASLSIFDRGRALSAGYYLGGLEVTGSGELYVLGTDRSRSATVGQSQLIRTTGMGTATFVGPALSTRFVDLGSDLTAGPGGLLYAHLQNVSQGGLSGAWGFDPTGGAPPVIFGSANNFHGSPPTPGGLSFDAHGRYALVSSSVGPGISEVRSSGGVNALVGSVARWNDHVVTETGRPIMVDERGLIYEFASLNTVNVLGSVNSLLHTSHQPTVGSGTGTRLALDPITGDIFYGLTMRQDWIVRIAGDFSGANLFATGFALDGLEDFDVGVASDGIGTSLYVAESTVDRQGTIYEFKLNNVIPAHVPEPPTLALFGLGLLGLGLARQGRSRSNLTLETAQPDSGEPA